jgi:hypothetical protein
MAGDRILTSSPGLKAFALLTVSGSVQRRRCSRSFSPRVRLKKLDSRERSRERPWRSGTYIWKGSGCMHVSRCQSAERPWSRCTESLR